MEVNVYQSHSTPPPGEKRVVVWIQPFKDRPYLMLQWNDPITGKRKSKSAKTCSPLEAEIKRADLEYELNNDLYQEPSKLSWQEFRKLFEAEYVAPLRPNTREGFEDTLNLFEMLCSPGKVASINARTVSAFAAAMRTKETRGRIGMKASSIHLHLQHLHTALAWAYQQEILTKVPDFPTIKVPRKKPQPIPPESFERLYAQAPDQQMRTYLLAGWLAGLRLTEACILEWERTDEAPWVDLAGDRIVLPAEMVKAVEDQWVPLDPVLREALLALPRHGKRVFRFIDATDGHEISPSAVSDRVTRLAKVAGASLTMHSLRKGFGCRYAARVPAQVLKKLMRHASIRTTMDFYANVDEAAMDAVLGDRRNTSRNNGHKEGGVYQSGNDATASPVESSDRS
jgi:integrase